MLAKLEIYGIVALVLLASATGAYFYARHQGVMEERGRWEAKQAAATKADLEALTGAVSTANSIAQDTAVKLGRRGKDNVIDRGVISHEIRTNTVYASDCFAPAGLRAWNDVSAGRPLVPGGAAGLQADPIVPQGNVAPGAGLQGRDAADKSPAGRGVIQRMPN